MDDHPKPAPGSEAVPAFTAREMEMIAEGDADVVAARVIPWEAVKAWLESWGTANELPPPGPLEPR